MSIARVPPQLTVGPFTLAEATQHGITKFALRSPEWRHVFREVWVHRSLADSREIRLSAVCLILRGEAFVCGLTAAWLYGIDVQDRRGDQVWVGHPTGYRPRVRAGMFVREITVDDSDLTSFGRVRITTQLRTAFDCARWLSLIEAVVVADYLAHAGFITSLELSAYARVHRGLRGCRQVARVLELMDDRSESPMETRLRLLLVLAGLDWLQPQYIVLDADRTFVARADLAFVAERVIVEYDGADHWRQKRRDELRREAIRRLGWTVIVIGNEDYYDHPDNVVARVRHELALADARA
jgi:hypothetical protein